MEPNVISFTVQEADNGWIVVARKSGQQIAIHVEADEDSAGSKIVAELKKHKSKRNKQDGV